MTSASARPTTDAGSQPARDSPTDSVLSPACPSSKPTTLPLTDIKTSSSDESPAKKLKRTSDKPARSGAAIVSSPSNTPALCSAPASVSVKVKPEAVLAPAMQTSAVVDVDAVDWADEAPMDFSKSIESVLSRVASPPNDLSPGVVELDPEPEQNDASASSFQPPAPSSKLPMSKLRSIWTLCAPPVHHVTKPFLMADGHLNRIDIRVFKAIDQRGNDDVKDKQWCKQAYERFKEVHKGHFRVPLSLRCDRSLFERADDALYIEEMSKYLFESDKTTPPILSNANLYQVFVTEDRTKALQHKLMWAVMVVRKKVLTPEDFFVVRQATIDVNKAVVSATDDEAMLTIPWDLPVSAVVDGGRGRS